MGRTQTGAPCCHCDPNAIEPARSGAADPCTGYARIMAPADNPSHTRARATQESGDDRSRATQSSEPESPADLPRSSLVAVLKRARGEFKRDNLTDLAASLTYYGVLSVAPALVVLVAAPRPARDAMRPPRSSARSRRSRRGPARSSCGPSSGRPRRTGPARVWARCSDCSCALWSASGYVAAFMRASNVIYDIPEGRPIWKTVPIRVGVTVLAVVRHDRQRRHRRGQRAGRGAGRGAHRRGRHGRPRVGIAKWPVLLVARARSSSPSSSGPAPTRSRAASSGSAPAASSPS